MLRQQGRLFEPGQKKCQPDAAYPDGGGKIQPAQHDAEPEDEAGVEETGVDTSLPPADEGEEEITL